jgi:hypothetical protein
VISIPTSEEPKISALLKEKSYEKNRSGEFPYAEFRKLESFFLE